MKQTIILGLLITLLGVGFAESMDWNRAMAYALARNLELRAIRHERRASRLQVVSAGAPAPLNLLITPALTSGGTGEELIAYQNLELNGLRTTRKRLAERERDLSDARLLVTLNRVLSEVGFAYVEAVVTRERLNLIETELQQMERTVALVRQQVQAGVRPGVELIQVEIEMERVRQHYTLAQAEARNGSATLSQLIGLPTDTEYTFTTEALAIPPLSVPELGAHPLALEAQAQVALQGMRLRYLQTEALPDIGIQLRVERWSGTRTRAGWGLLVSLPFLDYGARRSLIRAEQNHLSAKQAQQSAILSTLQTQLENTHRILITAQQTRNTYRQTILPRAEQLAQSAQVGLESGQLTILQVLEAQRTTRAIREELLQAERDYALAQVRYLTESGALAYHYQSKLTEDTR